MTKILIVGGGYAGFYAARTLEKLLRRGEASVTLVDPSPYMTYQPFLPEVVGASVEARHSVVSLRKHLKRTEVITARVTGIDHAGKIATITAGVGEPYTREYDTVIMTAGAVTRTFPIPGIADDAIGLKNIEEAVAIRDKIITNFDKAANLPAGPARQKLLTFTVVGGGFAGIETIAEMRSLASALLRFYPQIEFADTHFHLIEAMGRIMPEVSHKTSLWVIKDLTSRGVEVHLDTQLTSAVDGHVELSTGESFETDQIVWAAGVMANPMIRHTDLPIEERGRLRVRADLRVEGDGGLVPDAWGAGDVAAVPDLTGHGVGGYCVPNAQHAVRHGRLVARNVVAELRGEGTVDYFHKSIGAVAGLGVGKGVYQNGRLVATGLLGWLMHRGYHGFAIPTWERKVYVMVNWTLHLFLGRDIVPLPQIDRPRAAFAEYASRSKAPDVPAKAPARRKSPAKA